MLENWYEKNKNWFNEKAMNLKWKYTFMHRRTRSTYFSLRRNIKYLFIYQDYLWRLDIPNTTNGIEAVFSHIKYKMNLHKWLREERKIKLILNLLKV